MGRSVALGNESKMGSGSGNHKQYLVHFSYILIS